MDQDLKRIASELRLPQDSRERIRAQLASCQRQQEDVPMKKTLLKTRIPLIAAAVILAMAFTLTAGAVAVQFFRNDIIVNSQDEIPDPADHDAAPSGVAVTEPNGNPPFPLEQIIESRRFKSDGWLSNETINGGIVTEYFEWDQMEVLSDDPALRSRRVTREDGSEKLEYTAENPVSLVDTLTGRVTFDLSWMGEHYDYVPDTNFSCVVSDKAGQYVGDFFTALYAKKDGSGYIDIDISNLAEADHWAQGYIVDGSYETAYYYPSADGYEFLIRMHNGNVWVDCFTRHATVSIYGAYLTSDEIEDILDNLQLSAEE